MMILIDLLSSFVMQVHQLDKLSFIIINKAWKSPRIWFIINRNKKKKYIKFLKLIKVIYLIRRGEKIFEMIENIKN
jgi:hypothetical protein